MPIDIMAPLGHNQKWQTVIETRFYLSQVKKLLSVEEQQEVTNFVARNPLIGDLIPGTGGIRKFRFAKEGRGKSGGARVVYYYYDQNAPVFLLDAFGKNEKANLSKTERNALANVAAAMKKEIKRRRDG